jgi:hypothetical protein
LSQRRHHARHDSLSQILSTHKSSDALQVQANSAPPRRRHSIALKVLLPIPSKSLSLRQHLDDAQQLENMLSYEEQVSAHEMR